MVQPRLLDRRVGLPVIAHREISGSSIRLIEEYASPLVCAIWYHFRDNDLKLADYISGVLGRLATAMDATVIEHAKREERSRRALPIDPRYSSTMAPIRRETSVDRYLQSWDADNFWYMAPRCFQKHLIRSDRSGPARWPTDWPNAITTRMSQRSRPAGARLSSAAPRRAGGADGCHLLLTRHDRR